MFSVIAIAESDATLMQRERGCSESVKEELGEPHNTCEPFSIRGERETPVQRQQLHEGEIVMKSVQHTHLL